MNFRSSKQKTPYIILDGKHHKQKHSVKMNIKESEQLGIKCFKEAMQYMKRKDQEEQDIKERKNKLQLMQQKQCTFQPKLIANKYSRKLDEKKNVKKNPKYKQLYSYSKMDNERKRSNILKQQVELIRSVTSHSHQKSNNYKQQQYKGFQTQRTLHTRHKKINEITQTQDLPGVQEHYLQKMKAQALKNNKTVYYKNNAQKGFILEEKIQ